VKRVLDLIRSAEKSLLILMFDWRWYKRDFSCEVSLINHAILQAKRRGLDVRAVVNSKEIAPILEKLLIPVKHWQDSRLLHSKMLIVDGEALVLGSHNLTMNGMTQNVETSLLIFDTEIAKQASDFFESIWRL
jgi:phosphatidylserine/phosphatidylglycerophosphate/cardiolipin synthase-like enzyme